MKVTANFNKITGKIKPMHGVGQAPIVGVAGDEMFHYLAEAAIPYSRTHDVCGSFGGNRFADIHNIFRDFDADETNPDSYDFAFTDCLLNSLVSNGVKPFYRLGETIENAFRIKAYRIYPPKNPEKWARICEHIIRHYNEGWANGFHMGITYWEIWNEPEGEKTCDGGACFLGTQEEYFRLYEVTANHLKACFGDSVKVGGYASCGFAAHEQDAELCGIKKLPYETHSQHWIDFFHDFLAYISSEEHKAPLDFFSWHCYGQPADAAKNEEYCRKVLKKYGFDDVEDILDEWNTAIGIDKRRTAKAAATNLAMMLGMQKTRTSVMTFYDARLTVGSYSGLFSAEKMKPLKSYFAFMAFGDLYKLENEIETSSDNSEIYVGGAAKAGKKYLLISNPTAKPVEVDFDITGASLENAEILLLDRVYTFSPTGKKIIDGKFTLPSEAFAEIRF